jgi:hypothetical protein
MPKVLGPLFSFYAVGNLAKAINYMTRRGQPIVRKISKPFATVTPALAIVRVFMRYTVETWQHLTENIQNEWDTWASDYMKNASGFNAFTSYYMSGLCQGITPDLFPPS